MSEEEKLSLNCKDCVVDAFKAIANAQLEAMKAIVEKQFNIIVVMIYILGVIAVGEQIIKSIVKI